MKHIMLDIEAAGIQPDGVILSIGACVFPSPAPTFYRRIDLASSVLAGFTIDPDTIAWWQGQTAKARTAAFFCSGEVSITKALEEFAEFVKGDVCLWAKGPDYDCVMLANTYRLMGMKVPWSFRNMRDVRTVFALDTERAVLTPPKHAHNALDDALEQACQVMSVLNYFKLPLA